MKQGVGPRLKLVPVVGASVLALAACDIADPEPEYVGVCVHPVTEQRLDDEACGDYSDEGIAHGSGGMFVWIQNTSSTPIAPVGQRQSRIGTVSKIPAGKISAKGVDKAGAANVKSSVQRGGLGVKGSSSGTGAGAKGSSGS